MLAPPMTLTRKALEDADKSDLRKLLVALEPFRALRATMPLQYVYAFLQVALDEGKSVQEYAQRAGVSHSVMSRHLLDIGDRNRHMEEGFGLVTYRPNPMELRKHEFFLTEKGRRVANTVIHTLRK
jgi:DNA-binding transcriptional ArsR family regulator